MYLLQLAQFFGQLVGALLALFSHRAVTSISACATRTSFLPDLLQQLPPRISYSEHRAVNVIVIRTSLPLALRVLSLLLALQQIVVHQPLHRGVPADPIESRLLGVRPARGERSVHHGRADHPSFRMVNADRHE